MKTFFILSFSFISTIIISSCNQKSGEKENVAISKDTTISISDSNMIVHEDKSDTLNQQNSDYASYYIVIADTGKDYYLLRNKMLELSKKTNLLIDTLGRYYNKKKNLIVAESGADEFYAGEYFPRRFPSDNMSLEYLSYYQIASNKKTLALVTGIYENEKDAIVNYNKLIQAGMKPMKIKAALYIGCVH